MRFEKARKATDIAAKAAPSGGPSATEPATAFRLVTRTVTISNPNCWGEVDYVQLKGDKKS